MTRAHTDHPPTRSSQIYALLPATASEVACELEIPTKLVLTHLCSMLRQQKNRVVVVGQKREGRRGMTARIFGQAEKPEMVDWQKIVLNLRTSGLSGAEIARRIDRAPSVVQRIARGESKSVFFDDAVRLLDLHLDRCPDRHRNMRLTA